jgi:hypothetical protein
MIFSSYGEVGMASYGRPPRARIFAQVFVISCGVLATCSSQAMEARLPLSAACRAWDSHIADLISQHRLVHELDDDQVHEIIRLFYEAGSACSALRFEEGLAIYEAIPIGPVANRLLR